MNASTLVSATTDLAELNSQVLSDSIQGVQHAMGKIAAQQSALSNWHEKYKVDRDEVQAITSQINVQSLIDLHDSAPGVFRHVISELEAANLIAIDGDPVEGKTPVAQFKIVESEKAQILLDILAAEITKAVLQPHDNAVRHLSTEVDSLKTQISRFYVEVVSGESGVTRDEVRHAFTLGTILPFALRMTERKSVSLAEAVSWVLEEGNQLLSDLDSGLHFLSLQNANGPAAAQIPVMVRRGLQAFRAHFEAKRQFDHATLENGDASDKSRVKRHLQSTLYDLASFSPEVRRMAAGLFREDPALSRTDVNDFMAYYRSRIGRAHREQRKLRREIFKSLVLPEQRQRTAIARSYKRAVPISTLRRRVDLLNASALPAEVVAVVVEKMTIICIGHRKVEPLLARMEHNWDRLAETVAERGKSLVMVNPQLLTKREADIEKYLGKLQAAILPENGVAALTGCTVENYAELYSTESNLRNLLEELLPSSIASARAKTSEALVSRGLGQTLSETGLHQLERLATYRSILPHLSTRIERFFESIQGHTEIGKGILTNNWDLLTLPEADFTNYCQLLESVYQSRLPELGSGSSGDLSIRCEVLRSSASLKQYIEPTTKSEDTASEKTDTNREQEHRLALENAGWNSDVVVMIVRDGFSGFRFIGDKVIQTKSVKQNARKKNQSQLNELESHFDSTLNDLVAVGAVERGNNRGTMSLTAHLGNVTDKALRDYLDFARTRE